LEIKVAIHPPKDYRPQEERESHLGAPRDDRFY
jgi:hypothetical protein